MKALVTCHKTHMDLGRFKGILEERGFDLEFHLGYHDEIVDIDPAEHDLAIFMGGPMGVYQADIFPYLQNEIAYLTKRISMDKPTLGVCLGAQMIAKSQGEEVFPGGAGQEIGWHNIDVNEAGKRTPIRHLDQSQTKMLQWHGDTFDLPKNATLLASSKLYENQIFTIGKNILALQCHAEMMIDNVEFGMSTGYRNIQNTGSTVPKLRTETHERTDLLNKQTALFFNEWLDNVIGA